MANKKKPQQNNTENKKPAKNAGVGAANSSAKESKNQNAQRKASKKGKRRRQRQEETTEKEEISPPPTPPPVQEELKAPKKKSKSSKSSKKPGICSVLCKYFLLTLLLLSGLGTMLYFVNNDVQEVVDIYIQHAKDADLGNLKGIFENFPSILSDESQESVEEKKESYPMENDFVDDDEGELRGNLPPPVTETKPAVEEKPVESAADAKESETKAPERVEKPVTVSPVTEETAVPVAEELKVKESQLPVAEEPEVHERDAPVVEEPKTLVAEEQDTPTVREPEELKPQEPEVPVAKETVADEPEAQEPEAPVAEEPRAQEPKTPEEPRAQEAEAHEVEEPQTQETNELSAQEAEAPEADDPQTQEAKAPEPDEPQTQEAKAPEPDEPQAQEAKAPEPDEPQAEEAEAPEADELRSQEAEVPEADEPRSQEAEVPEVDVSRSQEAEVLEADAPHSHEAEVPESNVQRSQEAELPEANVQRSQEAEVPEADVQRSQEAEVPEANEPQTQEADEPGTEEPEVPMAQEHDAPVADEPETHVADELNAQERQAPEADEPRTQEPEASEHDEPSSQESESPQSKDEVRDDEFEDSPTDEVEKHEVPLTEEQHGEEPEDFVDEQSLHPTESERPVPEEENGEETETQAPEIAKPEETVSENQMPEKPATPTVPEAKETVHEADSTSTNQDDVQTYEKMSITNSDDYLIRDELDAADELLKDYPREALEMFNNLLSKNLKSPRATYGRAAALSDIAKMESSNQILEQSMHVLEVLLSNPDTPDALLLKGGLDLARKQHFRGWTKRSVKTLTFLNLRFPHDTVVQNELGVTYLLLGRNEDAKTIFQDVLKNHPRNGFAMVHLGFIIKTHDNNPAKAIPYLRDGIATGENGVLDARFYFHLGDAYQRVGQNKQAKSVYEDGAARKLFLSRDQRSLYNVDRLTAKPWWDPEELPYRKSLETLENNWETIRDEVLSLMSSSNDAFVDEIEKLREKGVWKQLTLYQRGIKARNGCEYTPRTCAILQRLPDTINCKRGQVKFSLMQPGTHVWPHCGPTNCRIRAHLGLVVPSGARIKVGNHTREWKEGKFIIFDDSFEHEVWHQGNTARVVLIVDLWHPELTAAEKATLPPI